MKNVPKLYASLLDKTKPYAEELTPALLKNLVLVGCLILVKETVNLNKLKNHVGILLSNTAAADRPNANRLQLSAPNSIFSATYCSAQALEVAHQLDDRLCQQLGWPLVERLSDIRCYELEVWGRQHSAIGLKPGVPKRQPAPILGQSS